MEVEEWGEKFEIPYSGSTVALKMVLNKSALSGKYVIVGGINKTENNEYLYVLDLDNRTFELKKNLEKKFYSRNSPLAFVSHNNLHVIGGFCTSITFESGSFIPKFSTEVFEMNEVEVVPLKEETFKAKITGSIPKVRLNVLI